jgi:transposase
MKQLRVMDARAAFVDVGSEHLHVSIAGGEPKVFGTMTKDLEQLRDWLLSAAVHSVAMEATGVYWMPLYTVLEAAGLDVRMVSGREIRQVPGRKTDMADCQWGATLHAYGLLRAGFVPTEDIRRLQDYVRLRAEHISRAADHVRHLHQALERMNIKVHDVISSLTGVSGLAMLRAILAGERDPEKLLALCDLRIRRDKGERIKESLRGTWRREHLFALRQAFSSWEHYQAQIAECDREIAGLLPPPDDPATRPPERRRSSPGVNAPAIEGLGESLRKLCGGTDLRELPGLTEYSILQLVAEVGTDLTSWPSAKHFSSWAGLAPGSAQSGKRRRRVKSSRNRVGRLLCVLARSLARSTKIALGGFYRRLAARRGGLVANKALARKLAELFWKMMVKGLDFVEQGLATYEAQQRQAKQRVLRRLAAECGATIVLEGQPA